MKKLIFAILVAAMALTGMAMPNTCNKLGIDLDCLVQDAAWAGVTAAQALYHRITEQQTQEPPRIYPVPVRASWE